MEGSIFPSVDKTALQVQDAIICEKLYDDFWTRILRCDEHFNLPKPYLSEVKKTCSSLVWLPSYAGVVVVRPLNLSYSFICLVGLDGWKSSVHASLVVGKVLRFPTSLRPLL